MERKRLPNDRIGVTRRVEACGMKFYATVNFYVDNHKPAEVFLTIAKRGSTVSGFAKTLCVVLSVALQCGVSWEVLSGKLKGTRFEPRDDEYSSLVDAWAKTVDEIVKGIEEKGD